MTNAKMLLGVGVLGVALSYAQSQEAVRQPNASLRHERIVHQVSDQNNGAAWWKLALEYQDAARFHEAEQAYRKAIELLIQGDPLMLANAMDCMGTMYVQMGRYTDAESLERKALALREERQDSLGVGLSWMHLAMLALGKHENTDGEAYAELAVERLVTETRENAATPEQKMTALTYLALARCAAHECKDAMEPLNQAMTIAERSYSEDSFPVSYIRFFQGYADWKCGNESGAAKLMKSGTEGMEAQLGWAHPTFVSAMRQYAGFLAKTRRNVEAAEVREKLARFAGSQTAASTSRTPVLPQ